MFLVELSYNTIKTEITDLSLKKNRKSNALLESKCQLTKDNEKLTNFIESDTMTTRDRNKEAEVAQNERKKAEAEIKLLDQKIQNVKSDIDKNIDQMNALDSHKDFLFKIFKTEDPKWVEAMLVRREKKLQEIKSEWIEMAKHNKILDDDDLSMRHEKLPSLGGHEEHKPPLGRRKPDQQRSMTYADWEHEFERRLKNDQIDVPADYYDEDVLFKNPDELMLIYSYLEDKNTKRINDMQSIEDQIEKELVREKLMKTSIGGEIQALEYAKEKKKNDIAKEKDTLRLLQQ